MGYWINNKPYKGTMLHNKDHVTPYWQCVGFNRNVFCDE